MENASSRKREGVLASVIVGCFLSTTLSALSGFIAGFLAGCVYRMFHPNEYEPLLIWASQYGGWSALAHGIAGMIGGIFMSCFNRSGWTKPTFVVLYTLFGTFIGVSIGIAETIVPNVYLPKQFWEAPFAAGIFGLVVSLVSAVTNTRLMARMLSLSVTTKITLSFVLIALTLTLSLIATGLAPIMTRVDFVLSTAFRFLTILLIIALMALYIRYRSFRREVDEQRSSSSLFGIDGAKLTSHEKHRP
jgi:hypothetical protein